MVTPLLNFLSLTLLAAPSPAPPDVPGDCDGAWGDEVVNARDVRAVSLIAVGAAPVPVGTWFERCDAVADGVIDARDARLIAWISVGGDAINTGNAVDWASDWSTAEGPSPHAVMDGGRWNGEICTDDHLATVVDGEYRYQIPPNNQCYLLRASRRWRMPAVGEYVFYRFTMRLEAPPGFAAQDQHFFHLGHDSSAPYEATFWLSGNPRSVDAQGRFRVQFLPNWQGPSNYPVVWLNHLLETGRRYTFELRAHRTADTEVRYSVRVTDAAGRRLPQELESYDGGGAYSRLEDVPAAARVPESHFRVIEVGYNGSSPEGYFGEGVYNFIDNVAVRVSPNPNDWIGP